MSGYFWPQLNRHFSFYIFPHSFFLCVVTVNLLRSGILIRYAVDTMRRGSWWKSSTKMRSIGCVRLGIQFFVVIFVIEAILKLTALGPAQYFKDEWNTFDFIVTALGVIELSVEGVQGLSVLRAFRLVSGKASCFPFQCVCCIQTYRGLCCCCCCCYHCEWLLKRSISPLTHSVSEAQCIDCLSVVVSPHLVSVVSLCVCLWCGELQCLIW